MALVRSRNTPRIFGAPLVHMGASSSRPAAHGATLVMSASSGSTPVVNAAAATGAKSVSGRFAELKQSGRCALIPQVSVEKDHSFTVFQKKS